MNTRACDGIRPFLSAFLDGALGVEESERVRTHLARCEHCRASLAAFERVDRALESLAAPAPPRGYLEELRSQVTARVAAPPEPAARRPRFTWMTLAPLAAAALVLVMVIKVFDLDPPGAVRSPREANQESRDASKPAPGMGQVQTAPAESLHFDDAQRRNGGSANEAPAITAPGPAPPGEPPPPREPVSQPSRSPRAYELKKEKGTRSVAQSWGKTESDAARDMGRATGTEESGAPGAPLAFGPEFAMNVGADEAREELATLERVERYFDAERFTEGHALLDSLTAFTPAPEHERAASRAAPADRPDGQRAEPHALRESAPPLQARVEVDHIRRLFAAYARIAERVPGTHPGQEAAARAAALAVQLYRDTETAADCEEARSRVEFLRERYPSDERGDSLAALAASLPCVARD